MILTAYGSMAAAVQALKFGAVACLAKPASVGEILRACGVPTERDSVGEEPILQHMSLQRAHWEYLQRVFEDAGSVSEAARRLGVDRRSLRRMLTKTPPPV